ncbi:hypothetical protein E4K66_25470 [Bradyrhizobium frederickii]|uniref:Uncharacterized protein n=1 Tax=Bradyrhizobium frederickii TaxID=2560054 RepID=A0A4Y9KWE1_9BRAD|nr:hypothetical protein [Bradyrhizobium frederickii]TFV35671.1 hypothetical protein E4K66_25470 [Bradyrhizobium frederickii]
MPRPGPYKLPHSIILETRPQIDAAAISATFERSRATLWVWRKRFEFPVGETFQKHDRDANGGNCSLVPYPKHQDNLDLSAMNNLVTMPIATPARAQSDSYHSLSAEGRDPRGRFAKGSSGRPFGAKGKQNREFLSKVKELAPKAFEKLCTALDSGERWSVEFVLNRVLPQSRTVEFEGATAASKAGRNR